MKYDNLLLIINTSYTSFFVAEHDPVHRVVHLHLPSQSISPHHAAKRYLCMEEGSLMVLLFGGGGTSSS